LLTQNIDDLHCLEVRNSPILSNAVDPWHAPTEDTCNSFSPFVYEIHGNASYMHCSDEE